jgi:hypothetical protein
VSDAPCTRRMDANCLRIQSGLLASVVSMLMRVALRQSFTMSSIGGIATDRVPSAGVDDVALFAVISQPDDA